MYGSEESAQFDSATIRKQVLDDVFGCVDKAILEKLHPDMRVDVNRVWQKLIETNVIDREGLLRVQSEKELPEQFVSKLATVVSNVGYFKGYECINGLSGTLGSVEESKSLVALYDADLVRIPTWKPKNFYEHVPLVAANEAVWLQNIDEEVKDQLVARRSVLIICNSISQVDIVQRGLERVHRLEKQPIPGKSRFAQLVRKHVMKGASWKRVIVDKMMTDCFENLIVYRRDHDEFELSGTKALSNGRLIIATNLAGRGTDIELSESLQRTGGLHVIVAFLPDNCRIEEQAFGRASRCGHPG
jgi:preprotein translocase subunit SecA